MAFAAFGWTRLITVNLSVIELINVIVAVLARFHFRPNIIAWHWVVVRKYSAVVASGVVRQNIDELMSSFVHSFVASDVRIRQLVRLDELISN